MDLERIRHLLDTSLETLEGLNSDRKHEFDVLISLEASALETAFYQDGATKYENKQMYRDSLAELEANLDDLPEKYQDLIQQHVKLRDQINDMMTLSSDSKKAVRDYIRGTDGEGEYLYETMNKKLTREKPLTEKEETLFKDLYQAFKHIKPLEEDMTFYRGVKSGRILDNHFKHKIRQFVSTSLTLRPTKTFSIGGGFTMAIHVPAGSRILPLFVVNQDEEEVLLPPGGRFELIDTDEETRNVDVMYIPSDKDSCVVS